MSILLCLTDTTKLKNLADRAQKNEIEVQMIHQIIELETTQNLTQVLSDTRILIERIRTLPNKRRQHLHDLHTLKGNARVFGLKHLSTAIHDLESEIDRTEDRHDESSVFSHLERIESLNTTYENCAKKISSTGSRSPRYTKDMDGKSRDILEVMKLCDRAQKRSHSEDLSDFIRLSRKLSEHLCRDFESLLEDSIKSTKKAARKLQKSIPTIEMSGDQVYILPSAEKLVRDVFMHLLTNAIDHGIEEKDERKRLGKNESGTITIRLKADSEGLHIDFKDDGKGLDVARIRAKALEATLIRNRNLSNSDIANFIFHPGLSTKQEVSEISGRGIGLDAVKSLLHARNCSIDIELEASTTKESTHQAFSYRIFIAKGLYFRDQSTQNVKKTA